MAYRGKKTCVFGCDDFGAYFHRFPNPRNRQENFRVWLATTGDRLKGLSNTKIFISKVICDYHFIPEHKTYGHRLSRVAVPSLYLEGVFKSDFRNIECEHNYCIPRMLGFKTAAENSSLTTGSAYVDHAAHFETTRVNLINQPSNSGAGCNPVSSSFILKSHRAAQRKIRKLKKDLIREKAKVKCFKTRLTEAEKYCHPRHLKHLTTASKIFTKMQIRQSRKKAKGRRFSMEEKILSLSLFKKSQKAYNLLYKYFTLPSPKTLKMLLGEIKISPGINTIIFNKLKETVSGWSRQDRLCTVMFDEMSLNPQIHYDGSKDVLRGFISDGNLKIANHALVFMVKGIKINFKQPVASFFTQSLNKMELKKYIKEVITNVMSTGLNVLCTVCDQSQINVGAIYSLISDTKGIYLKKGQEWRTDFFEIKKRKIIALYDVPHLLKGVRNNLLNKNMYYVDPKDKEEKVVKWEYLQMVYEADKPNNELTFLHKLTDEHIYPHKIKKMRVKLAAQVFSHSVAVTTEHLVCRGDLPEECRQIVPFVLLLDKLFDSLNSSTFHIPNGKKYRGAVKRGSPHHVLWQDALKLLKSVKFCPKRNDGTTIRFTESSAPSII